MSLFLFENSNQKFYYFCLRILAINNYKYFCSDIKAIICDEICVWALWSNKRVADCWSCYFCRCLECSRQYLWKIKLINYLKTHLFIQNKEIFDKRNELLDRRIYRTIIQTKKVNCRDSFAPKEIDIWWSKGLNFTCAIVLSLQRVSWTSWSY